MIDPWIEKFALWAAGILGTVAVGTVLKVINLDKGKADRATVDKQNDDFHKALLETTKEWHDDVMTVVKEFRDEAQAERNIQMALVATIRTAVDAGLQQVADQGRINDQVQQQLRDLHRDLDRLRDK